MRTAGAAFEETCRRLSGAGIAAARLEARVLVGSVLGVDAARVMSRPETPMGAPERDRLKALTARRARREPMAQILETREFWGLPLQVSAETLIPRPDSETLIEAALGWARANGVYSILDLGTGSGCLLLALLHELPEAEGLGVDISAAALHVAAANARSLSLADRARFVRCNWGEGVNARFDLIVANPPYIPEGDIDGLEPEVSLFEPRLALSGGADGLDSHRAAAARIAELLSPSGRAFIETGEGQVPALACILEECGLRAADVVKDLAGIERCVVAAR